jgi:GNAT superfamily N-acetyltransferase
VHVTIVSRLGGQPDAGPFLKNVVVTWTVRRLTAEDAEQARRLGLEAFGVPATPPSERPSVDQPGFTWFGAFDGDVLAARVVDREFESWFGGVRVPTCGIAGVTVAAEYRGQGILTPLFVEALEHAKQRGSLLSGLFPTAARIYRRFGYELIADYASVEVRTQALASVTAPHSVRTRRARVADFEAVREISLSPRRRNSFSTASPGSRSPSTSRTWCADLLPGIAARATARKP